MGYYKLHSKMDFQGLPVSIEQGKGGKRYWTDESTGETGVTVMEYPYGYVRGTLGTDGDEVDVFIGPNKESSKVFVITQQKKPDEGKAGNHPWVETDEQKVMLGFDDPKEAQNAYMRHFDDERFFGKMIELTMDDFKEKLNHCKGELIKNLNSGTGHPLIPESLRGTEQLGWFTNPEYLPPNTKLFIANNKVFLHKPESDSQTKDLNNTNHRLRLLNQKLKDTKVSKGLKDNQSPAIIEDNISMLTLSKSTADEKFKPASPRSGAEEIKKYKGGKEHPVSEAQRKWAYAAEERGELPEGTADEWSERAEGKDLPKETKKAMSDKVSLELCKGFGYEDPTEFLYKFPSDSPLQKEAIKLMEECLSLEKELDKDTKQREKLWSKKDKLRRKKDELLLKQWKKDNKMSKSFAVETLRKAQASLSEEEMDLKKQNKAYKSQEDDDEKEEETEKSFDLKKALQALVVSGMSKRARMDAAYQLGRAAAQGNNTPFDTEPAKVTNLNVGTDRTRPTHEPPVVPVRRVETPREAPRTSETMKSCSVHGYVHKSEAPCPLCTQAGVSEAKPYWRR